MANRHPSAVKRNRQTIKRQERNYAIRSRLRNEIRKVRGYTLPVHDTLADLNPEFLRRYGDLASHVLFGPAEGRALDLKTRFLVLIGVTTAVKGDPEGMEWSVVRALKAGATWDEVREAAFMAALPAGDKRRQRLLREIERAFNAVEMDDVHGTADAARALLQPALQVHAREGAHHVVGVGHAHIDNRLVLPVVSSACTCGRGAYA